MQKFTPNRSVSGPLLLPILALAAGLPCVAATPTLTTLYSFEGVSDGGSPAAGLVLASNGVLYGTTWAWGTYGWGTVFDLVPGTGGTFTQKTLYSFTGGTDGANPMSDLVLGKNGTLYGTTYYGGKFGYGTVFGVQPSAGGKWVYVPIYSFQGGNDGANPAAGLVLSSSGILYGTTYAGGPSGLGTVFQVIPSVSGTWTESVIYSFLGGNDGANPMADLTLVGNGTLYGTTFQGGSVTNSTGTYTNWGTVFSLTLGSGSWTESVLYVFTGGSDGGAPESAVIPGPNGTLYGSTFWGGVPALCIDGGYPDGCGTVYQLTPPSGGGVPWTETVLHTFSGRSPDGAHPYRNMALNPGGMLFGTTFSGGVNDDVCFPASSYTGCGTIFTMKPPATPGGKWTKSNLMIFNGDNGGAPNGVVINSKGIAYGTTMEGGTNGGYGTAFQVTP